ncbi:MAG: FAD-binding oxidoreductase [Acidimicrobiales bacterium]|jgi:FAD/FMN-containing dehydrogenase
MAEFVEAPPGFLQAVRDIVGPANCLCDPDLKASYELDWTRRYGGPALVVIRPADTSEVARVLSTCGRFNVGVVPQGGNTGLVGGSVPRRGEAVLSLRRLDKVLSCNLEEALLVAQAGTTLSVAHSAAAEVGCELGIDIAARDSATLGGMVATNAGGVHVIRYGPMRARLRGLEVVLADGTIASRLSGLVKDNVGYDIAQIMAGSEGTLGVVTKVALDLVGLPRYRVAALIALRSPASTNEQAETVRAVAQLAVAIANKLRRRVDGIDAIELIFADGVALVREAAGLAPPPDPGADAWLLVEASGGLDPSPMLAEVLEDAPGVSEVAVADQAHGRARLWAYRERHTEAIASLGVAHKLDVTLPLEALAGFAGSVRTEISSALGAQGRDCQVILFGHVGDGNLHVNVIGPEDDDCRADDAVFAMVIRLGGSISAEHGVGIAKLDFVTAARSPGDITVMRRVKNALDPGGILNPGVLLPPLS